MVEPESLGLHCVELYGFIGRSFSGVGMICQTKFVPTVLLMCLVSVSASATKCQCKQHSADAEGIGTCSRTEDPKHCTLTFTATTAEDYQKFVSRLKKLGLNDDPHEILRETYEKRPETYSDRFVAEDLPILFAISQRESYFQERTAEIVKTVRENKRKIQGIFMNPEFKKKAVPERFGEFEAVMSYGCIELSKGPFRSMVKTRWAESNKLCDDFLPKDSGSGSSF